MAKDAWSRSDERRKKAKDEKRLKNQLRGEDFTERADNQGTQKGTKAKSTIQGRGPVED